MPTANDYIKFPDGSLKLRALATEGHRKITEKGASTEPKQKGKESKDVEVKQVSFLETHYKYTAW